MKTITSLIVVGVLGCTAASASADKPAPKAPTGATPSAQQQCRTERAQMGVKTFGETYGTNAKRTNAFGKCVSKRAKQDDAAAKAAKTQATKTCDAEQAADPAAFAAKYGTGKKGANAHGKCVSAEAKRLKATSVAATTTANVNAAKSCKAQRTADGAAFAAKYGKSRNAFGKCVSAAARA
ncbi:hypothetical protein DSM112329_01143 [Paraconexibacter sp. AEG42_29]|uniref:Uncharacterized protein n=1 Tax=Paraconexibacter sp. AEG42_29 TaxID=2997339 RepID=A0AAU7ARP7_9ACTN